MLGYENHSRGKVAGELTQNSIPDLATASRARRTTRILESVRLKIVGVNRVGIPQVELTSAVTVNCHGCLYLSRHEHRPGSWMTLEVSDRQTGARSAPVRAKVRFVRLPRSPRELYRVGVELEAPANIWGIEPVPGDWLPYSPDPSSSQSSSGKIENAATPSNDLIRAGEGKAREAAELPLASVVASHVQTNKEAVKAIEIANQERTKVADSARLCDALLIPARVGFLSRLNGELANAGERLFERAAAFVARTQTASEDLGIENGADEIQPARTAAGSFSTRLVSGQVNVRAGKDVRYWIKIDTSKMLEAAVTGWFRASGGSKNDIALVIATEPEFENLVHGHEARVLFATDSITAGEFHVSITQSGTYVLALNNRFSIFMPRTFIANIDLCYSTPRQVSSASEGPA